MTELDEVLELTVSPLDQGKRLDSFLAEYTSLSRSAVARLAEQGHAEVEGKARDKKYLVKAGERVSLFLPLPEECDAKPENIPLHIVYEDKDLLVVNKPQGMVVHPAPGNPTGTLVNALLYHAGDSLSGIGGEIRPGIVHRIDKDTSGLLVVAKHDEAHLKLSAQLSGHHIQRVYYALVQGGFKDDKGTVNLPIGRHPTDRKKMAVLKDGQHRTREAVTHYEVLSRYGNITFLKVQLETGRTHQIRVHMSHLGHPLLGDPLYGASSSPFEKKHPQLFLGQCLHAGELSFTHPISGEEMHFECELPENFKSLLQILEAAYND